MLLVFCGPLQWLVSAEALYFPGPGSFAGLWRNELSYQKNASQSVQIKAYPNSYTELNEVYFWTSSDQGERILRK